MKQQLLRPLFFCAYALFSLYVFAVFLVGSEFGGVGQRSAAAMLDGTAMRPTVYRVLLPTAANAIIGLTPEFVRQAGNEWLAEMRDESRLVKRIIRARYDEPPSSLDTERLYDTCVVLLLVYASLCGYLYFLYQLAMHLWPQRPIYAQLAPLVALVMIPPFHSRFAYIYDYAAMMFMTAGIYYLATDRLRAYLVVLVLATLNRETSIYLIVMYGLWQAGKTPPRDWLKSLGEQALLFMAIKTIINFTYADNPGDTLSSMIYRQMTYMYGGYNMLQGMMALGFFALIAYRWAEKPRLLQLGMWLLPLFTLAYFMFGLPGEYRVFMEFFPIPVLLFTHTLVALCGSPPAPERR